MLTLGLIQAFYTICFEAIAKSAVASHYQVSQCDGVPAHRRRSLQAHLTFPLKNWQAPSGALHRQARKSDRSFSTCNNISRIPEYVST
ncbi:hypothetical protein [uncultured Nostoc sp.]|uniref:hypothetical protein n=1 Tax=uncultured Nostoc sp. TaxID=340711 RepID=UPI00262555D7|nr:hypothetical protein [uncultured Nostoc sp.]